MISVCSADASAPDGYPHPQRPHLPFVRIAASLSAPDHGFDGSHNPEMPLKAIDLTSLTVPGQRKHSQMSCDTTPLSHSNHIIQVEVLQKRCTRKEKKAENKDCFLPFEKIFSSVRSVWRWYIRPSCTGSYILRGTHWARNGFRCTN